MSRYLRVRIVADRVIAALLLVPCAPVIAALGWLVRRHDGGPALIAVERIGRGGTTFRIGLPVARAAPARTHSA